MACQSRSRKSDTESFQTGVNNCRCDWTRNPWLTSCPKYGYCTVAHHCQARIFLFDHLVVSAKSCHVFRHVTTKNYANPPKRRVTHSQLSTPNVSNVCLQSNSWTPFPASQQPFSSHPTPIPHESIKTPNHSVCHLTVLNASIHSSCTLCF